MLKCRQWWPCPPAGNEEAQRGRKPAGRRGTNPGGRDQRPTVTPAFTAEADKFRNYASAWRDRWNSLMELFMTGGNYAASEVRVPEGVPGFRAGGDCGSAVGRRTPARGAPRVNYTVGNRALAERNVNKLRVVQNPTRAPATICNVLHRYAPGCNVREPLGRLLSSRRSRQLLVACQAAVSVSRGSIARTALRVSADRSAFRRS